MSPLTLHSVTVLHGDRRLFAPISVEVNPGVVVSVVGRSGAGKSSLLARIAGVLPSPLRSTGRVLLGSADIDSYPPEARHLGLLFQDDLLFPHLSVGQNLEFGMRAAVGRRSERKSRVDDALESVGLGGFIDRDPATLSGGQRARVALLRVLLAEPVALLLDEPFGRLDADTRGEVRDLVFRTASARRLPVLLVTHDDDDVRAARGPVIQLDPTTEHSFNA